LKEGLGIKTLPKRFSFYLLFLWYDRLKKKKKKPCKYTRGPDEREQRQVLKEQARPFLESVSKSRQSPALGCAWDAEI
jgi:hypothetical protein